MWQDMWTYLQSWFRYSGLEWDTTLIGIGLALGFVAFWLAVNWPPLFKKHWLWGVAVFSAFFTVLAIVFIQLPIQIWIEDTAVDVWYPQSSWWLLITVPHLLTRGLVQEGARMVPIVFWWWRSGKAISPKMSMAVGALAGAGFGIFEAARSNLSTLGAGWTWEVYRIGGFEAIAGFWDAFFNVGFYIAVSAFIGYGLAKGKGWQFYLIGAGIHILYNYKRVLLQAEHLTVVQAEVYAAVFVVILTAVVLLWFRRASRREAETGEAGVEEPAVTES
jgi:RsiW-degrading membrane proteinase PrsW (M82 family)